MMGLSLIVRNLEPLLLSLLASLHPKWIALTEQLSTHFTEPLSWRRIKHIITQDSDSTLALRAKVSPRASWVGNWASSTNELTDTQCRCLWNMESHPIYTGKSFRILSLPVVLYMQKSGYTTEYLKKIKFLRQQRERSKEVLQNKSFIFWIHQQNSLKI